MPPLRYDPIAEARRQWQQRGWTGAAVGMSAVTSVMRAQQILLSRVDRELRPFGLTFARFELLMLLSFTRDGRLPLSKIGQLLQVHPTSVTSVVDRLQRQGYVERMPHPTDRRATLARLTDRGEDAAALAVERLNERVFGNLGMKDDDAEKLVALLEQLRIDAGDYLVQAREA